MQYAVFAVMMPEYSPAEAAPLLREAGYEGVEWRVTRPAYRPDSAPSYWSNNRCTIDIATVDQYAPELARLTRDAGLEMPALGTYLNYRDLPDIERAMRAAAEMGVPRLRVGPAAYDRAIGYPKLFAATLAGFVDVQKLAQTYGVQACIEIHPGNICSSPSLAERLLRHFDPRYIGAILDPGNMIHEGYEDWRLGMEVLGPYLAHVHLKNAGWEVAGARPTGETDWRGTAAAIDRGIIDFRRVLEDLRAVGYDSWGSFEDFSASGSTRDKLARNIAYMRALG